MGKAKQISTEQPAHGRLGDVAALARIVQQLEPDSPTRGPEALAARRRMVAAFFKMIDRRGHVEVAVPSAPVATPPAAHAVKLTPRLRDTLQLLLQGDSEKQIARKLKLSPHTVHYYVKDLHKRFEVASRAELLAKFIAPSALVTP